MVDDRVERQEERNRADAQRVDHAASYLRQRLHHGQFAGMSGVYAGYTMCGLLDGLARELRTAGLPPQVRSPLAALVRDLAREETSPTPGAQLRRV